MISLPRKKPCRWATELDPRHTKTQRSGEPLRLTPEWDGSHLRIVSDAHCVLVSSALNRRVEGTQMTYVVEKGVVLVFRNLDLIYFLIFLFLLFFYAMFWVTNGDGNWFKAGPAAHVGAERNSLPWKTSSSSPQRE